MLSLKHDMATAVSLSTTGACTRLSMTHGPRRGSDPEPLVKYGVLEKRLLAPSGVYLEPVLGLEMNKGDEAGQG